MLLPQSIRDLFRVDTNPVISLDEESIPKTCAKERSRVILATNSSKRVTVHYRKHRQVVGLQK